MGFQRKLQYWYYNRRLQRDKTDIAAIRKLGELGDPRAIQPLLGLLGMNGKTADEAANALEKIPGTFDPLCAALGSSSKTVRQNAALLLGRTAGERALPVLIQHLKDTDRNLRRSIVSALGNAHCPYDRLSREYESKDCNMRAGVVEAMGALYGKSAVRFLISALQDKSYVVVDAAKDALANIPEAINDLLDALGTADTDLNIAILDVLKDKRSQTAVTPVLKLLNHSESAVREKAIEVLVRLNDRRAVEPLVRMLKTDSLLFFEIINALRSLKWEPKTPEELAFYCLAEKRSEWGRLKNLGSASVEPAIVFLNIDFHSFYRFVKRDMRHYDDDVVIRTAIECRNELASLLAGFGDSRAAETVLNWLFSNHSAGDRTRLEESGFRALFHDYTEIILQASRQLKFSTTSKPAPGGHEQGEYNYDIGMMLDATKKLAAVKTAVSSNILYLIAQRKDFKVKISWVCSMEFYGNLSLEPQRRLAREELDLRGNHPYNPAAFLEKNAWKI